MVALTFVDTQKGTKHWLPWARPLDVQIREEKGAGDATVASSLRQRPINERSGNAASVRVRNGRGRHPGHLLRRTTGLLDAGPGVRLFIPHDSLPQNSIEQIGVVAVGVFEVKVLRRLCPPGAVVQW